MADEGKVIQGPWFPAGAKPVVASDLHKLIMVVYGASGAGKSHLGHQLINDPAFGPNEVLFAASEEAASIYGSGAMVLPAPDLKSQQAVADSLVAAAAGGKRLPKVLFVDSISSSAMATIRYHKQNPTESWNDKLQKMTINRYEPFGEVGSQTIELFHTYVGLPMIVIALCTTYENPKKGGQVELAVEGEMIPKFLTPLSTCALYLKQEAKEFPKEKIDEFERQGVLNAPHRMIARGVVAADENAVAVINRFFYSQSVGEVLAKGHRNLAVREAAYLPDVLRKILGAAPAQSSKGGSK